VTGGIPLCLMFKKLSHRYSDLALVFILGPFFCPRPRDLSDPEAPITVQCKDSIIIKSRNNR
jgi:hypothetical protein